MRLDDSRAFGFAVRVRDAPWNVEWPLTLTTGRQLVNHGETLSHLGDTFAGRASFA